MKIESNSQTGRLRSAVWTALTAFALCLVLGLPAVVSAEVPESEKSDWQQRYADVITRARSSEQRVADSKAAYSKAKQRDRLRGNYKVEIMENLKSAEDDYARDQRELDEFPEKARQAGVPPGWLREVEDRLGVSS